MISKLQRVLDGLENNTATIADLAGERLGNQGAQQLAVPLRQNVSLEKLVLGGVVVGCDIGDEGLTALAEALQHNRTLSQIDLRSNRITDKGAIALAKALSHNENLLWIDLRSNQIEDKGKCALTEALKSKQTQTALQISLDDNPIVDRVNSV